MRRQEQNVTAACGQGQGQHDVDDEISHNIYGVRVMISRFVHGDCFCLLEECRKGAVVLCIESVLVHDVRGQRRDRLTGGEDTCEVWTAQKEGGVGAAAKGEENRLCG